MMNKPFKIIASGLLMTLALTAVNPVVAASEVVANGGALLIFTTMGLVTTTFSGKRHYDTVKAQSLIDEAYSGAGDKLDILSVASKRSVEAIADTIVTLDKDGKLDATQPEQMAKTIAAAIQ